MELKKTYKTDRPVNSAAIAPVKPHVSVFSLCYECLHNASCFSCLSYNWLGRLKICLFYVCATWTSPFWILKLFHFRRYCSWGSIVLVLLFPMYDWPFCFLQVVLGGGQEAMDVTTTSTRIGKFDARFYHLVFEEEFARVKGHFGPINSVAFHPDGKG